MGTAQPHQITGLLRAWAKGDESALEDLIPLVEGQLQGAARRYLDGKFRDPSVDTASLVNETYIKLLAAKQLTCQDRAHFFALSAHVMRGILVDHVRSRASARHGGTLHRTTLDSNVAALENRNADLVAIDEALNALAKLDARKARVVELRFFGGYSVENTAELLSISPESVKRDWRLAKLWLRRELSRM